MNAALDQEAHVASITSPTRGPANLDTQTPDKADPTASAQESRHLLSSTIDTNIHASPAANYGALNTSRLQSQNGEDYNKSGLDVTVSELDSSSMLDCSQMGESVRYREHVSQYTRERAGELLMTIKDRVTFFGMSVLVLVPATLLANGIGHFMQGSDANEPLIVQNGCNIGLDKWYIFFTCLVCAKLLIEVMRYMYVKINY